MTPGSFALVLRFQVLAGRRGAGALTQVSRVTEQIAAASLTIICQTSGAIKLGLLGGGINSMAARFSGL
jgi:hypothetical protein